MNNNQNSIQLIENNHLGHFEFLPKKLGFNVTEVNGVTIINCGYNTSMFNIAYGAPNSNETNSAVQKVKDAFNCQPFAWWIPPSQYK